MEMCTSIIITILLQLFNSTMAEWNWNSPLILIEIVPLNLKTFPMVVYKSEYECKMYHEPKNERRAIIYSYCPSSNPNDENRFCNYAEPFYADNYLIGQRPKEICDSPLYYDMIKVTNLLGEPTICNHHHKIGYLYRLLYWRCEYESSYKEATQIYDACYQDDEMQIILGNYTIESPSLLGNELLEDEQNYPFTPIVEHNLYEQNPNYVPRTVLPSELLPFGLQRRSLFYYMNLAPMDVNLIQGWKVLMKNLKLQISRMDKAINVTAGLLGVLTHGYQYIKYLGYVNVAPAVKIPKAWWLLIYDHDNTEGVVIMMHNEPNIEGRLNMERYDARVCGENVCTRANLENSLPKKTDYPQIMIYCCYPSFIIDQFNLQGSRALLKFPTVEAQPGGQEES